MSDFHYSLVHVFGDPLSFITKLNFKKGFISCLALAVGESSGLLFLIQISTPCSQFHCSIYAMEEILWDPPLPCFCFSAYKTFLPSCIFCYLGGWKQVELSLNTGQ